MRISEPAFLDLLKSQGLTYTHQTKDGETTYVVEHRKDAIIYFGFREGRCMSVQRSNGFTMG